MQARGESDLTLPLQQNLITEQEAEYLADKPMRPLIVWAWCVSLSLCFPLGQVHKYGFRVHAGA